MSEGPGTAREMHAPVLKVHVREVAVRYVEIRGGVLKCDEETQAARTQACSQCTEPFDTST